MQNVGPVPGPGFDPDSSVVHFRQQRPFCEGQEEDHGYFKYSVCKHDDSVSTSS